MPALTQGKSIRDAVSTCISSSSYAPPPLPHINEAAWPSCFNPSEANDENADQERDFYHQTGLETLRHCIFLLLVDQLAHKPAGFVMAIQNAILFREVLAALAKKIDEDLLANIPPTSRVDVGVYQIVGVLWQLEGQDTMAVAQKLRPVLEPLLEAAGRALLTFLENEATKAKKPTKNKHTREVDIEREKAIPSDLQFVFNVRAMQRSAPTPSPEALRLPHTPHGVTQHQQFGYMALPGTPLGGGHAYSHSGYTPYGPAALHDREGLSPSAFGVKPDAAAHGDVLTQDFHDLALYSTDLAAAGASTVHRPRALLKAKHLLEKLLSERDGLQTPSPAEVSAAMKDLLTSILNISPDDVHQLGEASRPARIHPLDACPLSHDSKQEICMPHFSPGHRRRSSSLPPGTRTSEHGRLGAAFEFEPVKKRQQTPKNETAGGSNGAADSVYARRRPPFTPSNGRQGEKESV
ncbi:hypothetical protein DFH06DRAFT_1473671 [Mycena polygramma]|nr:hypothetical protein DFH06DRAFT_1473671 [Mycena polygramma]